LKWITQEDQLKLSVSDPNIHQRYVLVLLSFQFSLNESSGCLQSDKSECDIGRAFLAAIPITVLIKLLG
jgi:hypothetical protein